MFSRWKTFLLPVWVMLPLALLGLGFLILYPLPRDWTMYGAGIVVAALSGFLLRRSYQVTLLEFSETETELIYLTRMTWRKSFWRRRAAASADTAVPQSPQPPSPRSEVDPMAQSVTSQRVILPAGIAHQQVEAIPAPKISPPSGRSRLLFWIGAGSLPLSVIIVGGLGGVVALVGGMSEWQRAKRDGEDETRRKSLQACVLGVFGLAITVVALILY